MKNKKGFTLAEVLVTLAVIGVVAALTIPTLMSSTSEKQAKTSIKKALSVLNQALTMSIAEDGVGANSSSVANSLDLKNVFANYMSTLQNNSTHANITTADGMIYTFDVGSDANCAVATDNDGDGTTCVVEVDINGDSGSEAPGSLGSYSDLYYFLIYDGNVVPANTLDDPHARADFRSNTAADIDNVALDALIN